MPPSGSTAAAFATSSGARTHGGGDTSSRPRRQRRGGGPDTLETLAARLALALCVAVMDANLHHIFDEWHHGLVSERDEERFTHDPLELRGLIPVPPTGRLFGFLHRIDPRTDTPPGDREPDRGQGLTAFEYAAVGRWFVAHFHDLLAEIDGRPGPHVLALSGTSWLPDSSSWHFALPAQGILEPDEDARVAIADSEFHFLPLYEPLRRSRDWRLPPQRQPLAISGARDLAERVRTAAPLLAGTDLAPLAEELRRLGELGARDPRWRDRQRILILVNSYQQAEDLAREIAALPGWRNQVYGLRRGTQEGEDQWAAGARWHQALDRASVERFHVTGGTVLVAPTQAIGRGYNMLNEGLIAAFGAVYFLIRPMPHPFDLQRFASALNHQVLAWCADERLALWRRPSLYQQGLALRRHARRWWKEMAQRQGYQSLSQAAKRDLAATMAGQIVQACGRLLRGGVPFHAFFVDAKWAPRNAAGCPPDSPGTSLLAAMIAVLEDYQADPIGASLYAPLVQALRDTHAVTLTLRPLRRRASPQAVPQASPQRPSRQTG